MHWLASITHSCCLLFADSVCVDNAESKEDQEKQESFRKKYALATRNNYPSIKLCLAIDKMYSFLHQKECVNKQAPQASKQS